jgi:hypothetical protein
MMSRSRRQLTDARGRDMVMGDRPKLVVACIAIAVSFALTGTASSKSVEPFSFSLPNIQFSCSVESTSPLVRDSMRLFGVGTPGLVQHTILLERAYNPNAMRGSVKAVISAGGPNGVHSGTLHGVMTPEGMHGTIHMTLFREDGLTDKFVGKWFGIGHPVTPCDFNSVYRLFVDGHYIVS